MTDLSEFHEFIQTEVPTCPGQKIDQQLILTAREICQKTSAWTYDNPAVDVVADQPVYTLTSESGDAEIIRPKTVLISGEEVYPKTKSKLDSYSSNWRNNSKVINPKQYIVETVGSIELVPGPSELITTGLEVTVIQRPTMTTKVLPDFLLEMYSEVVIFGTLWRLFSSKGKWKSVSMSKYYGDLYKEVRASMRIQEAERGNTTSQSRVKFNSFI